MTDLQKAPFHLSKDDIAWVEETIDHMTIEEQISQLFCVLGNNFKLEELADKQVGGVMFQPAPAKELRSRYEYLQLKAKIPLLLAANTEYGGIGVTTDGTHLAKPMLVGATGDESMACRLGYVACRETAALGGNWSFAPVTDIDYNFRSPIVNVRSYGKDPDQVLSMCRAFLRGAGESQVAVSIKHFPGDGVDDRDQHLHVTVNSLSADEWMNTYGRNYRTLIEDGAQTVMVGHIAQPAWVEKLNPEADEKQKFLPASLSKELIGGLLRQKLGFNGMIVSDATSMLGFTTVMPRKEAVPMSIMAGVDMILFNNNYEDDYAYMMEAYQDGTLTKERLREALTRILGLKASLRLHEKQKLGTLIPPEDALQVVGCEKHQEWAKECADLGITLVKDTRNYLPVTPEKYRRIALLSMESIGRAGDAGGCAKALRKQLEAAGFEVYEPKTEELDVLISETPISINQLKEKYDLFLYCFNLQTVSNQTTIRPDWKRYDTCNMPWMNEEIPTIAVSFANPYHLYDIPEIHTYVNAYTNNEYTIQSFVDKLMGKSAFHGSSPVDPFCGREDTKF